jgi:hypothetical protein
MRLIVSEDGEIPTGAVIKSGRVWGPGRLRCMLQGRSELFLDR